MQKMREILLPEDRNLYRLEYSHRNPEKICKEGFTKKLQPKLNSKETTFEYFESVKIFNMKFKAWGNSIKLGSMSKTTSPSNNIVRKVMFNM